MDVTLSKLLSKVLRHRALEFGFKLTPDGYVPVQDLLKHKSFAKYTVEDILRTVDNNEKQRFQLTTGKLH